MTANLPAACLADRGAMINKLVYQVSDVVRARSAFLSGDERPSAVRPEIFAYWRRSALLGAQPDIAALPFRAEIDSKDALHVAARPVLDRLADRVDRTTTALLLADRDARWKGNWEPGADPERRDYASFADSDGNTWMLQEICYCPGTHRLISTAEEAHDVAGDGLPQRERCPG